MNYHNITHNDMVNGEGLRVVLWVAGCNHHCKGCHNPETWDINSGILFDQEAHDELMMGLSHDYIEGVTFSGGDPLHPCNRKEIFKLIEEIKEKYPNKTVWLYTGYTIEQVFLILPDDIRNKIDVICEGPFIESMKSPDKMWVGSNNQRVIYLKKEPF